MSKTLLQRLAAGLLPFLLAADQYGAKSLTLLGGAFAALGARYPGVGAPLDNQWDLAGAEMSAPSAYYTVAHSQYRYGQEAQAFIEDQPLVRGQAFSSAVKASFADFAIGIPGPGAPGRRNTRRPRLRRAYRPRTSKVGQPANSGDGDTMTVTRCHPAPFGGRQDQRRHCE